MFLLQMVQGVVSGNNFAKNHEKRFILLLNLSIPESMRRHLSWTLLIRSTQIEHLTVIFRLLPLIQGLNRFLLRGNLAKNQKRVIFVIEPFKNSLNGYLSTFFKP